jgi:putative tricarboxylic transport membrane protein
MPKNDSGSEKIIKRRDPWLGIFCLVLAILVFVFSRSIEALGFGDNHDPGPKAFPLGLSVIIACGGLFELFNSRINPETVTSNSTQKNSKQKTILLLLGGFLLYVVFLPLLGFALSTLVMATGMMMLLGNTLKSSAIVSIILITVIYLLFVVLFKVPLPGGVFGMPF